ncbi:MAG: (Fe-S)-binding protein, partial [Nitrososphaerales archaeon]
MKQTKIPLSVKQLIELDGCARCELCREFCSLYALLNENPHPLKFPTSTVAVIKQFRSILRDQFGLKAKLLRSKPKIKEKLWMLADALFLYCTTCGRCKVVCPLGIDTWSLLNSVREYFMNNFTSQYPTHCVIDFISNTINTTIQNSGNIFNVSNASRHDWALYTGADIQVKDNAKVVYFVGCVSSYQGRAQDIAHAITAILNSVGEDWTLLKDEWCCGHPLTISGAGNKAKSIAE